MSKSDSVSDRILWFAATRATGRFTQEDPIGLAGGMNLFGFAGGDPINSGDAFGLHGCERWPAGSCRSFTGADAVAVFEGLRDRSRSIEKILEGAAVGTLAPVLIVGALEVGASLSLSVAARAATPAIPILTSGRGHDMLQQAVRLLSQMSASSRVAAFRDFAAQIMAADRSWRAQEFLAANGTVFAGENRILVFDAFGKMYRGAGDQIAAALIQRGSDLIINYSLLTPIP